MALKEFSGELTQEPQLKAFSGELEGAEPSLKDRIYRAANNLFGRGSVMDNYDSEQTPMALPLVDPQTVQRVLTQNAYAKAPSISASDTRMVSGLPGVLEVGARKGYAGIGRIEAGAIKALADMTGSETLTDIADNQSRYADQVENAAVLRQTPVAGFGPQSIAHEVPQAASNAIGSVLQTAPSLATGALAPQFALPALFATTALQEYGEGRQAGLGGGGALLRAIPMAGFEVAGEKLGGFDKIARGLNAATRGNGAAQLGGAMLSSAAREVPGEEFTTAGQFLTDKLPGVGLNQEATLDDYIKAAKDTALATVLQSGGMAAGGKALQGAANRVMPTPAPQAAPENVTIIGNPAPVDTKAAATNLAKTIADTATMDSKLKPAPDNIELVETPQAPEMSAQALEVSPETPEVSDAKILQNRNRATPSSIAQMTSIAANPDYGRLSFSRDFANGAPVVAGGTIPANQLGTTDVAVASDGRRIPVQYAVVDASELLPSNRADGLPNEAYDDPTADLTRAIAGNGRVAGLQEAYNKATAGEYRKELLADSLHGVDPAVIENMTRPVLVRVMPNEFVTADIGDVSNTVGNLELSPVEQANNDVQRVNLEALSFADDGSVTAQAVRQFVQAMPQAEQGSLLDTNGQPTKQAVDRLNAAIFAKAYGNDQLIRLYAQAQNGEARNVLSALAQVAPKMARLAGAGHLDIRQVVTDAAEIVVNAVRKGLTITRAAQQIDMTADPDVVEVLQLYAANVRSSRAVAEALGRAADFAYSEAIKPAEDMFGEVPKASRQEVLAQLRTPDEQGIPQDIQDAQGIGGIPQDSQRAAVQPGRPGNADGAGTGRPVDDTTVRQDAPEYGLDSYTNRDIVERLDRIEKAQKEAAERAKAEEAKRQADLERETFGLTGSESPTDRLEAQGQGRLFQPTASYQTNPEALAAIERAYGGRTAYDAAKASGKTELSYDDWLLVRTPAFREAFGNWEALRVQKKLDAMTPIKINVPDAWRGLDIKTLRSKVEAELLAIAESGVPLRNNEIGDVAIAKRGIGKAMSASADPAKLLVLGDIRNAFESSILASTSLSDQAKPNVVGYEKLLANVEIDGQDLIALFTIERLADGRQFYNSVTLEGNEKTPVASPRDTPEQVGERATLANTGVSKFIRRQLDRVNPASINGEINPRTGEPANPGAVNIAAREYSSQYGRQLDFFLDYGPDQSQAGAAGEAAQRAAVSAVDDLHATGTVLGKALSSDYATGQRATLVGRRVDSAEDLATLAQVYRDPRFETFRLIFVNDAGRVVSQLGLTSRLPTSAQAIIGDDTDAYLAEVSKIAKQRGATRYWMLHNHPSGLATPSNADLQLTRTFSQRMPGLTNNGHVVIDTNEYGSIDAFGDYTVEQKNFGAVTPLTAGEFTNFKITGPSDVMDLAKRLDVDQGAVTILGLDAQLRVQRISTVPSDSFSADRDANRTLLLKEALAGKANRVIVVGRDIKTLVNASKYAVDAIHIAPNGVATALSTIGDEIGVSDLFPPTRRPRVSPDTGAEFDYLRGAERATNAMIARQSAWHGSPYRHDGFDSEHIGSGEGAQAYGWGHYFASMRDIAEWYRDNLSSRKGEDPTGKLFSGKTFMEWYEHWQNKANRSNDPTEYYDRMSMLENAELTWNPAAAMNTAIEEGASQVAVDWFKKTIVDKFERPGSTYEVDIPEDSDMLDWDKPLSEQRNYELLRNIAKEEGLPSNYTNKALREEKTGADFYAALSSVLGSDKAASQVLDSYGIKGIKYLDSNSRTGTDAKPSHNYVVFDDKAIKILSVQEEAQKYGAGTTTDTAGLNGEGDTARSAAAFDSVTDPQSAMNLPAPGPRFDPIRTRDWFSTERAANGQRQYAAGRKLWDRASGYAAQYLGNIKLVDTKPGTFKELLRQFNVDKTKASQQAKRFAESGKELSQEQRTLLSDLIEKQVAVGDTTPQEIVDLAATITTALDVQARELVDLGMLSEDRLVKNYLPRLYKSGLAGALTNPAIIRSWFTKARMRIRGDRLKSRGMFAEIAVNQVEQAKKLGWRVSAMTDGTEAPADLLKGLETGDVPAKYQDSKVLMWRDYTQSEREQMGEIRDGVLRYALGYVETQKDIAIGRLFKAIASNPELAKDHNPGGWVKVPDQEIAGAPGTKAYGALSGMWVEPQVADSLKRNTQPKGVLMAAYDKALSFWKEGKTVWNPVAHGNNVVSNLFTIHFAGINPADPRRWRETLREYRTKGQYYNEALDNGLFGNEWANQEIQDLLMPDFASMSDMEDVAASRVAKVVELAKKAGKPVSFYREKMQKAYEFEDQFFKLMLYIDRRKAGMDPQAAITDAERYVFNYADMPEGVELIKRTVSPFFAYTYKAIPMVLHTAMTRPDRMLAPIALLGGANWLAYMMLGADEDEERKAMPEYMKGRTFIGTQKAVRLPFNIDDRPAFLDMSRRVPLGDLFDINNQTNGLPLPAPFMPSHPVLSMMQAVIYNQDTFTGRDLVKKSDTGWEAAQARAGYVARQFMPNAPFVPGSYNFNKLADATAYMFDTEIGPYTGYTKSGDPIRMGTVLPDVLTGTKIRTFDVDRGMAYQNADLSKEAKEIQANIRSAQRNKAMTESAREKFIEGQQEKLRRLGERRTDLNQ